MTNGKEIEIPGMEKQEVVSEIKKKDTFDIENDDKETCLKEDASVADQYSDIEKNRQNYMLWNLVKWMMVMQNRFIQIRMYL